MRYILVTGGVGIISSNRSQECDNLTSLERRVAELLSRANKNANFSSLRKANDEINDILNIFALHATIALGSESQSNSQNLIRFYKCRLGNLLLHILHLCISRKKTNTDIGKNTEGYIAYSTWARPPSITQFVNNVVYFGKLSQEKNVLLGPSYGC